MKKNVLIVLAAMVASFAVSGLSAQEIYEMRMYHNADMLSLDNQMQEVVIPAYNRHGVHVGAYTDYGEVSPSGRYYLFVYPDAETYHRTKREIRREEKMRTTAENPEYLRYDTWVAEGVDGRRVKKTDMKLLEWQFAESPNEQEMQQHRMMLDNGEVQMMEESGVHPILIGEILAGPDMPGIMYLSGYNDMNERNAAWDRVSKHPKRSEYRRHHRHHVHHAYLMPLPYSQY